MAIKTWIKSIALTICMLGMVSPAMAKVVDVKTAWVAGQEGFPIWYAKKQGWDKKVDLNLVMSTYASGQEALMDFEVNSWVLGGLGAIPTVNGAKNGNMIVIGIANDESKANAVMVHNDSPILLKKGATTSYPAIYGTAVDIRKKVILTTPLSSAHYTMTKYLEALGVSEKEVVVKNLDQALALLSFEHDKGDLAVFWAPYTFMANGKGWATVATARDVDARLPLYLVANKAFAAQYPEVMKKYLTLYMRGLNWLMNAPREEAVKEMQAYYKEVFDLDYSETMVDLNFNVFELFDLATQKALFAEKDGSSEVQKWQDNINEFMLNHKAVHKSLEKNIIGSKFIVSSFINMVEEKDLK